MPPGRLPEDLRLRWYRTTLDGRVAQHRQRPAGVRPERKSERGRSRGQPSWLIAEPERSGEIMTNALTVHALLTHGERRRARRDRSA